MKRLTKRQRHVLELITSYQRANGYPPTVRELCAMLGLRSTSTVASYLSALERKGVIIRVPASPRAIRITAQREEEQ